MPLTWFLSNTKEPIESQSIIEKYNKPYTCVGHLFVLQSLHRQRNWSKQMQDKQGQLIEAYSRIIDRIEYKGETVEQAIEAVQPDYALTFEEILAYYKGL